MYKVKINKYKRLVIILFLQIFIWMIPLANAGKLVIVIDDIGYRSQDQAIYHLPKAVNVSIIPAAPYATVRAKQAFEQQRDILIHLPMQPLSNIPIETGALKIGMSKEKIKNLIVNARKKVPYAIGLNNHMGSAATADRTSMSYLMDILAENKLFFLDSVTSGKTVAADIAKSLGIPTLKRNVFLDDSNKLADVQNRFDYAVRYAQKNGLAILIGHPRNNSIKVLQQGLKNLPDDVQLVNIGSLWRNEKMVTEKDFILFFEIKPSQTSKGNNPTHIPLLRGVPKE
ncbi:MULTISPECIES: divergent polysaccharide deacetylase family protein [Pasteurellaceae]|uniref:Divergent polysaccharide deacetylase family protein n=1 Tax=Pasteurella atlantica TaxID=2827233 RepID=A0AAW8CFI3_9PAST|nr:divergent polysaccharide deacetylase family protein [Pasteurella atlantica]MDP8038756.1 divergent polysaccharide deacetylase family protein [Pasteurella atlantica]MDP8040847.1 divergent polysaccharide deacetylase family protein [Pasteurella atlantica]MDP8042979.1 divergent polysaccharide deacetylase family protein [Pasteurella atlantica]MDP8045066.1 divergent polysaccharide deacetylase family protein [Pasteurella atlantica]MDP8060918.1 divergent polysaccharide deacetylase family protein [Pa